MDFHFIPRSFLLVGYLYDSLALGSETLVSELGQDD
jgi:hypothetical protein